MSSFYIDTQTIPWEQIPWPKVGMKYHFHLCVVDVFLANFCFMQGLLHLKSETLFLSSIKLMNHS